MMTLQTMVLSMIQGVTEFLPISSSAHLIVLAKIFGWVDPSLGFSVALHTGTLLAVLMYFWRDFMVLCTGGIEIVLFRHTHRTRYTAKIIVATLPILAAGLYFKDAIERQVIQDNIVFIIAFTSIIFGILLWLIDKMTPQDRYVQDISYVEALLLGALQVLALIPGVSRAGICMTAGRMLGLKRTESAKISLLMGMPTLLGAVVLMALDWYTVTRQANITFFDAESIYGMVLAFVVACTVIHFMMVWFRRFSMGIFAVYRILLGIVLLILFI